MSVVQWRLPGKAKERICLRSVLVLETEDSIFQRKVKLFYYLFRKISWEEIFPGVVESLASTFSSAAVAGQVSLQWLFTFWCPARKTNVENNHTFKNQKQPNISSRNFTPYSKFKPSKRHCTSWVIYTGCGPAAVCRSPVWNHIDLNVLSWESDQKTAEIVTTRSLNCLVMTTILLPAIKVRNSTGDVFDFFFFFSIRIFSM